MLCRACSGILATVVDLGGQPSGGHFPGPGDVPDGPLPLRLGVCHSCGLAQLVDPSPPEDDDPAMPSPLSSSTMAQHANAFADELIARGVAGRSSRALSLASHGGHLAPFLTERGLHTTILEASAARAARLGEGPATVVTGGIDDATLCTSLPAASFDLVVDSYLLAHLEHPRLAIQRMAGLLAPAGTLVLEFDHLLATVEGAQWDAIRHGHHAYLALGWVVEELRTSGLEVVDAVPQSVYGGSLRIYARAGGEAGPSVEAQLAREATAGIDRPSGLGRLADAVERARREVIPYLRQAREAGRLVVGYGAPARSITFLNALGIGPDLLPYTVDRAPSKQGRIVPGVRIPIRGLEALAEDAPAELLILAWDLAAEVIRSLASTVRPDTAFLVAVPRLEDVTHGKPGEPILSKRDDMR